MEAAWILALIGGALIAVGLSAVRASGRKRRRALLPAVCLCAALLAACGSEPPPSDGTPEPPPLEGTFVCEGGSLTFNGDGRSVELALSEALAAAAGLPAGRQTGGYVFLFRNEQWRYDKAETFRLTVGDAVVSLPSDPTLTDEDSLALRLPDGSSAIFEKAEEGA